MSAKGKNNAASGKEWDISSSLIPTPPHNLQIHTPPP